MEAEYIENLDPAKSYRIEKLYPKAHQKPIYPEDQMNAYQPTADEILTVDPKSGKITRILFDGGLIWQEEEKLKLQDFKMLLMEEGLYGENEANDE
jgi:hypothetical protein